MSTTKTRPETAIEQSAQNVTGRMRLTELLKRQEVTLAGVIVVFCVVVGLLNPAFLSSGNLVSLVTSTVVYFVLACGLTLVVTASGFDFSVGSTFTLGAISATWLMSLHFPWPLAIIVGIIFGCATGVLNALVIDKLRVPPIITTLGTFYLVQGVVVLFTGGQDISPLPTGFDAFGQTAILGVPLLVVYGVIVGVIYHIVLQRTRFGYNVKAYGGSRTAAIANGISARRTNFWVYTGGAGIAALAGILFAAQTGSGQVEAGGASVTLTAISAVLIGGTSLFGGIGSITGTALGALLFASINNGLAVANVPALYSSMIIGAILIIAVALDSYRRQRSLMKFRS